jgi:hypothetical protein
MLEDYFEEEEEQQQQLASAVAITKNSQRNQPTALMSVFSLPKKAHSAPDVTRACAWCHVSWNITHK